MGQAEGWEQKQMRQGEDELDNTPVRGLRGEHWSCIAALKPAPHTMSPEEHELQDMLLLAWPLKLYPLLCKHSAPIPDFTRHLQV